AAGPADAAVANKATAAKSAVVRRVNFMVVPSYFPVWTEPPGENSLSTLITGYASRWGKGRLYRRLYLSLPSPELRVSRGPTGWYHCVSCFTAPRRRTP